MTKTKSIFSKGVLSSIFFVFFVIHASAQTIRLNTFGSYVFNDRINSYYDPYFNYKGTIKGGLQWGAALEYLLNPTKGAEIKYLRRDATAPVNYYYGNSTQKYKKVNVGLNYILAGGTNYFPTRDKIEPFVGASAGLCIVNIKNADVGSDNQATKFAWGFKIGSNVWVSEKVALKLQADLLSVSQSAGGSLYFGTGGVSTGVSLYSSMYQWGLGGGLTFKMN